MHARIDRQAQVNRSRSRTPVLANFSSTALPPYVYELATTVRARRRGLWLMRPIGVNGGGSMANTYKRPGRRLNRSLPL